MKIEVKYDFSDWFATDWRVHFKYAPFRYGLRLIASFVLGPLFIWYGLGIYNQSVIQNTEPLSFLYIALGFYLLLLEPFRYFRNWRRFRRGGDKNKKFSVEFAKNGIHMEHQNTAVIYKWSSVSSILENNDRIIIWIKPKYAIGIPKRFFEERETLNDILRLIQDNLQNTKYV